MEFITMCMCILCINTQNHLANIIHIFVAITRNISITCIHSYERIFHYYFKNIILQSLKKYFNRFFIIRLQNLVKWVEAIYSNQFGNLLTEYTVFYDQAINPREAQNRSVFTWSFCTNWFSKERGGVLSAKILNHTGDESSSTMQTPEAFAVIVRKLASWF